MMEREMTLPRHDRRVLPLLAALAAFTAAAPVHAQSAGKFDGMYLGESSLLSGNCAASHNIKREIRGGEMKWEISGLPPTVFKIDKDGSFEGAIGSNQFDGQVDAQGFTATRRGMACSLRYTFKKVV